MPKDEKTSQQTPQPDPPPPPKEGTESVSYVRESQIRETPKRQSEESDKQ